MTKPTFIATLAGRGPYEVRPYRLEFWPDIRLNWFNLWRKGDRFPLAGGPMDHIMRAYKRLP